MQSINDKSTQVPEGTCVNVQPAFTSFEGGLTIACPKGKTPSVMAYPETGCTREAGTIPTTDSPRGCVEIVVETEEGGVAAGGQSGMSSCV